MKTTGEARQPPCSDRGWPRRCGPLLVFLGTPRTWGELATWASERGVSGCRLRNMLAWLEGEGVAGTLADRRLLALGDHRTIWRRYDLLRPSQLAQAEKGLRLSRPEDSI